MDTDWILKASDPAAALAGLERRFGRRLRLLERAVLRAAEGSHEGAREYLIGWRDMTHELFDAAWEQRPDLQPLSAVLREAVLAVAPAAPFSRWVSHEGLGGGIALRLLVEIRTTIPDAVQLRCPRAKHWQPWADAETMQRALRVIEAAFSETIARTDAAPLWRVMELFGLDRTEFAGLFGVTRQAVEQWEKRGVPADRLAKLGTIQSTGELLHRKLRRGTLPGVARTPAPAYGDRSMLDMIAADEHTTLLADVRASFDWAATA